MEIGKRTIEEIGKNVRISIVKWSEHEYNVRKLFNQFPSLYPHWDGGQIEILDEKDLGSSMQVYRYIEDARQEYHAEIEENEEFKNRLFLDLEDLD